MTPRQLLNTAFQLIGQGFAVLPIAPRSKRPLLSKAQGGRGYLDGTTDLDVFWRLIRKRNDANLAIACEPSGIVVVDVDPRNGGRANLVRLEKELGPLPYTMECKTGGKPQGWHLYFKAPEDAVFKGEIAKGVDLKHRGYVLVPDSQHPSGQFYRWRAGLGPGECPVATLPEAWLANMLKEQPLAAAVRSVSISIARESTAYGLSALQKECAALRHAARGGRNNQLNRSTYNLARLVAGGELEGEQARSSLVAAGMETGLPELEVLKTVKSAWNAGLSRPRCAPNRWRRA